MDDTKDDSGIVIKVVNSGDKGGGTYNTGSMEETRITQSSSFSYNWFKTLYKNGQTFVDVPVITDNEIWKNDYDYEEMRSKEYFDKAQRFWYKAGLLDVTINDAVKVQAAKVSNSYDGNKKMTLNYKNEPDSILRNYFLMMVNNNNNYTVAECYLTAQEYADLNKSLVKLNGDLYHPAEVDGYDPLNRKKCRLKLIRKIM